MRTAVLGLNTERYKQSSFPSYLLVIEFCCGQRSGVAFEFRVPVQGAAGFGGMKRRLPTGGSAKGILQNVSTSLLVRFLVIPGKNLSLSISTVPEENSLFDEVDWARAKNFSNWCVLCNTNYTADIQSHNINLSVKC